MAKMASICDFCRRQMSDCVTCPNNHKVCSICTSLWVSLVQTHDQTHISKCPLCPSQSGSIARVMYEDPRDEYYEYKYVNHNGQWEAQIIKRLRNPRYVSPIATHVVPIQPEHDKPKNLGLSKTCDRL